MDRLEDKQQHQREPNFSYSKKKKRRKRRKEAFGDDLLRVSERFRRSEEHLYRNSRIKVWEMKGNLRVLSYLCDGHKQGGAA